MVQRKSRRCKSILMPFRMNKLLKISGNYDKNNKLSKSIKSKLHEKIGPKVAENLDLEKEPEFPEYIGYYFRELYDSLSKKIEHKGLLEPLYTTEINLSSFMCSDIKSIKNSREEIKINNKNDYYNAKEKLSNSKSFNMTYSYTNYHKNTSPSNKNKQKNENIQQNSLKLPKISEDILRRHHEHVVTMVQELKVFENITIQKDMLMLGNKEILQKDFSENKLLAIFDMDETLIHTV